MSRIGKQPIKIPEGVEVKIDKQKIAIKGPKGELIRNVRPEIKIEIKDNYILVSEKTITKNSKAFWGLERALLQNMVIGVLTGFEKQLEIRGIGYKAKMEGEKIILETGFSHSTEIIPEKEIKIEVNKNIISISGIDKVKVGQMAAKIRKVRPPDRYKGKGIRYLGEEIKLKPGKKAITAG
ncbi:MAG: 50S ribosomal protein L6 [Candidatus Pacebacteria bacterium]|nr:50S ribosomal protein L6 [Candidatus Paceibacterota bacterium]